MPSSFLDDKHQKTPTDGHTLPEESLAHTEPEEKGAIHVEPDNVEIKDAKWHTAQPAPAALVGDLTPDETWILIRRFNLQIFHVKSITTRPLTGLDMNIADNEDISSERLRAQLERLYVTVAIGLFSCWKHIARLRSWRERQRTSLFLLAYAIAWLVGKTTSALIVFVIILILYPPVRDVCFPFAPPSLFNSKTGAIQKPRSGVLASPESFTGAPENYPGEAVEQEAQNFIKSIGKLTASISTGKDPQGADATDPAAIVERAADAREVSNGDKASAELDKTKKPVVRAVEDFEIRSTMHMLPDFVDTWERVGNALSPRPPFDSHRPRLLLACCLLPWLLILSVFSWDMLARCLGLVLGFAFFGSPIINPSIAFVNRRYPNWRQLRCTLLRGVPTNAQIAVALLRAAERNKTPLPPPPASTEAPRMVNRVTAKDLAHLGATEEEVTDAIEPQSDDEETERHEGSKPKISDRALEVLRRATKRTMHAVHVVDKAKTNAGIGGPTSSLSAVKSSNSTSATGPVQFEAHYRGRHGYVYITTTATTPAVSWKSGTGKLRSAWVVMVADIVELEKVSGLGWKSKAVVGWAMEQEVADGLVVKTRGGEEYQLTAIGMRDEVFNRLVAIGNQMWEAC